ncbi:MAG TPA: glycosyltransferase [Arcobacter sp.]|nr:glycosyltransferase [Arcobacter sp.]
MNIMQVVTHIGAESAGPSYSVPSLCTALQNRGCDVTLYTLNDIPDKESNFKIKSFPRNNFPVKALGRSAKMYETMLRDAADFDLIHSHMLWMSPNYYSGLIANKLSKPYVCSPRGTLSKWALSHSIWKKKIVLALGQKKALDTVSCFHVTAQSEAEEVFDFGYRNIPATIIPNGIDIPLLSPKKSTPYKRLTFLSRIHPKKGIENLLEAWEQLEKQFSEWELAIVGPKENDYAKKIIKLVKDKGIKRVTFTGEIKGDDKIEFLRDSYLFVLPTYSENFGMVVAEALACELPVICSKGAPWSGLEEHNSGWWIEIGVEPLRESLEHAMGLDDFERVQMGQNGREWMKKDFSWDKIAENMIKTYEWILKHNEKPDCVQ